MAGPAWGEIEPRRPMGGDGSGRRGGDAAAAPKSIAPRQAPPPRRGLTHRDRELALPDGVLADGVVVGRIMKSTLRWQMHRSCGP